MKGRPIQIGSRLTRPDPERFPTNGSWWAQAPRAAFIRRAEWELPRMKKGTSYSASYEAQGDASRRRHKSKSAYPDQDEV
jgi:hypothetical protein